MIVLAASGSLSVSARAQSAAAPTATDVLATTWTEMPQPTAPSGLASANSNLASQGYYAKGPLPAPAPSPRMTD